MALPHTSPVRGPSAHLNEAFGAWWYTLNAIGLLGFELFLECRGAERDKHFYAAISFAVILWLLTVSKNAFPKVVRKLRRAASADDAHLQREVMRDYLGVIKMPFAYFPYMLGFCSLGALALWPVVASDLRLYIPEFMK